MDARSSDLEFKDDVTKFQCIKCGKLAIDHFICECNHNFCDLCVQKYADEECPVCCLPISLVTRKDPAFEENLFQLNAHCPNMRNGCITITMLIEIPGHLRRCKYATPTMTTPSVSEMGNYQNSRQPPHWHPLLYGTPGTDSLGPQRMNSFGPQSPGSLGSQAMGSFGPQGMGSFGPQGMGSFRPQRPGFLGHQGTSSFAPQVMGSFGPQGMGPPRPPHQPPPTPSGDWRQTEYFPGQQAHNPQSMPYDIEMLRNLFETFMKQTTTVNQTVTPMDTTEPEIMSRGPPNSRGMPDSVPIRSQKFKAIPGKDYNILLMGPTGVGKSTFINAFVNYLNFESLDEAEKKSPKSLIACKFSVSDENFQEQTVYFGSDSNEDLDTKGQSATQSCKAYEFPLDGFKLRIIDTPGIGDTRGIDQDRKNVDGILNFLSDYDDLYAICILLKPNDSRLTPLFSFCIKQLLCHLHTNASNNIVFIFTNSRNTFYRPGDTATPLKTLLGKISATPPHPKIPYGKDNIFCLDNEAFRFLVALKNGIKFSNDDRTNFGQSWAKSVDESERMIRYIVEGSNGQGLTPHNVHDTLGVNKARDGILDLAKPLSELSKNIQNNLQVLTQHKQAIEDCKDNEDKLKTMLYMPVVTLDIKELDQPRTVCAGADCREAHQVGNQVQYHYPKKCHDPCYLQEVPRDIVGAEGLRHCAAINSETAYCHQCSCHYSVHLHIYYESEVVDSKVVDENIKKQIKTKEGVKQAAQDMVTKLEAEIKKYKAEEKILTDSTAKLAVFLKHNAMVVCNDAFKEYLNELIENEKSLSECGSKNAEVIKGLKKMLDNYEIEKDILEKALKNPTSQHDQITTADVEKIINDISNMKISGVIFKKATQAQKKAKDSRFSTTKKKARNFFKKYI